MFCPLTVDWKLAVPPPKNSGWFPCASAEPEKTKSAAPASMTAALIRMVPMFSLRTQCLKDAYIDTPSTQDGATFQPLRSLANGRAQLVNPNGLRRRYGGFDENPVKRGCHRSSPCKPTRVCNTGRDRGR